MMTDGWFRVLLHHARQVVRGAFYRDPCFRAGPRKKQLIGRRFVASVEQETATDNLDPDLAGAMVTAYGEGLGIHAMNIWFPIISLWVETPRDFCMDSLSGIEPLNFGTIRHKCGVMMGEGPTYVALSLESYPVAESSEFLSGVEFDEAELTRCIYGLKPEGSGDCQIGGDDIATWHETVEQAGTPRLILKTHCNAVISKGVDYVPRDVAVFCEDIIVRRDDGWSKVLTIKPRLFTAPERLGTADGKSLPWIGRGSGVRSRLYKRREEDGTEGFDQVVRLWKTTERPYWAQLCSRGQSAKELPTWLGGLGQPGRFLSKDLDLSQWYWSYIAFQLRTTTNVDQARLQIDLAGKSHAVDIIDHGTLESPLLEDL